MIWRTHIDILMLEKCNPLSQLREHDAKIQTTHAEHYKESDSLFFEQVLLNNAYKQSINTMNDLLKEYVKYSCLMKTFFFYFFLWKSLCWIYIENTSVALSLILSIFISERVFLFTY